MTKKYRGAGLDVGGAKITTLGTGTADTDAVNFGQVKSLLNGVSTKDAVDAASTANVANLASPGASIDGVTLTADKRYLIKDQTTASQNGIYRYNGSALVRADDMLTGVDARAFAVAVRGGTTNDDTRWIVNSDPAVVGTDNIAWTSITSGSSYVAGDGLTESPAGTFNVGAGTGIAVNANDVALAASAAGAGLTHTTGVLAVGAGDGISVAADAVAVASTIAGAGLTWTTGVAAVGAGTGITVNADDVAINTSTVLRKYSNASIGDNSATQIDVTHGISGGVTVVYGWTLMETSTGEFVDVDFKIQSSTVFRLNFLTAPTTNQYTLGVAY